MTKHWLFLIASVALAVTAIYLSPEGFTKSVLESPSLHHWLGTDNVGRDVLRLALQACGTTLIGVSVSVTVALLIGTAVSIAIRKSSQFIFSGSLRSVATLFDAMGPLLPAIAFLSIYPRITVTAMGWLLGLLSWPSIACPLARLLDDLHDEPYVVAGRALGGGLLHQLRFHLWFPCARLLLPLCVALSAGMVAILASLQFLGAFSSSEQSVGTLLYEGLTRIQQAPWCLAGGILAFCITLAVVFGTNYGIKGLLHVHQDQIF